MPYLNPLSPEVLVSHAKAPPAKKSDKGFGDENEFQVEASCVYLSVLRLRIQDPGLTYTCFDLRSLVFTSVHYIQDNANLARHFLSLHFDRAGLSS